MVEEQVNTGLFLSTYKKKGLKEHVCPLCNCDMEGDDAEREQRGEGAKAARSGDCVVRVGMVSA